MLQKKRIGWYIIIFLSLSPIIFWYFALQPVSYRFYNLYSTFMSLGQLTGLVGTAMYMLSLALSIRAAFLEDYFGGLNRVYIAHHVIGALSLVLLLLHPLFLALARATFSWEAAALLLLPGGDWSINLGIAALLFMISLLLLTLFIKIPYHIWLLTHKFLGGVFILGAIHGLYVQSDIVRFLPLKIWMFILITLGILAYAYKTLWGKITIKKTAYKITHIQVKNTNITEMELKPLTKAIKIVPGQFVFISFYSHDISPETHPFSVSDIKPDGTITLAAKVEGDYTRELPKLHVNDTAMIEGGYGRFTYSLTNNKSQIWIAGGIGIVPFLSMAHALTDPTYEIYLYYSVRTPEEAYYLDNLTVISQKNPHIHINPHYTKTMGRISIDSIAKQIQDLKKYDFFVCGPPSMMQSIHTQLKKYKIREDQIHSEEFTL